MTDDLRESSESLGVSQMLFEQSVTGSRKGSNYLVDLGKSTIIKLT